MKKHLLIFAIGLLLLSIHAKGQTINFQNLANMNLMRGGIGCSTDSNFIYVSNGYKPGSSYTTEIEKYDIANNIWSIFTNSMVAKMFGSSVIVSNNLYLFNGNTAPSVYNNKMEVVNLSDGTVTFSTDNPVPAHVAGAAVWNGEIYVFGGSTDSMIFSNKLYKFNTSTQIWTHLTEMPEAKEAKGEIINGKLYVFGGYKGINSNRIDMYDIASDTWTNLGFMSDSISSYATAVFGSEIYLLGSYSNLTHLAKYSVTNNTYTVLQSNMIGRRHAGAAVINGKLYIAGGNTSSNYLSSLQMTNLQTTGIENIVYPKLRIYPNPVSNTLLITNITCKTILRLYDEQGKLVIDSKAEHDITLDVSDLAQGVYTLIVENTTEKLFNKVVISK